MRSIILLNLTLFQNLFIASAIDRSNCKPLENLGSRNLDRYHYSTSLDISKEECTYSLGIKFKHDDSLPIPNNPREQCDPSFVPPEIASDGLPYFASRWAYKSLPKRIKKATGIDHISIDFNPCGHPPFGVFTVPHYDVHVYLVDPEYRSCMTCETMIGAPVCNAEGQTYPSGRGFFNIPKIIGGPDAGSIANMPKNFSVGMFDMVELMGGHGWDVSKQPSTINPWVDPVWVMGPYDGKIVNYEPMIPLSFMVGDTDKFYEEDLTYLGQTISILPTKYRGEYDAASGFLTLTLEGKSNFCKSKKHKKGKRKRRTSRMG